MALGALIVLAAAAVPTAARGASAIDPIEYPNGTIGNARSPFIWQDLYSERDRRVNVKYRLTVKGRGEADGGRVYLFTPTLYHATYYAFYLPEPIPEGAYEYTIDRVLDGTPVNSRFYHYRRYPLRGDFTLNFRDRRDFESLETAVLIRYLTLERDNLLNNGYNALFFTGSGTITLGVGILFYSVIHLGIWSTLISAVCFTSSAIGYGAAGYYAWHYYGGRGELANIIDAGRGSSLNDPRREKAFTAGLEMKF
jgi:hypothetical protein